MDWIDASPEMVRDLDHALDYVWEKLDAKNQAEFRSTPRDKLWQFHHGLGRAIRNDLLYGRDIEKEGKSPVHAYFSDVLGITEGDDISGIIIEALWCKVNEEDFDLKAKVQSYKDYWRQQGSGDGV
jgi:hypothetical protein